MLLREYLRELFLEHLGKSLQPHIRHNLLKRYHFVGKSILSKIEKYNSLYDQIDQNEDFKSTYNDLERELNFEPKYILNNIGRKVIEQINMSLDSVIEAYKNKWNNYRFFVKNFRDWVDRIVEDEYGYKRLLKYGNVGIDFSEHERYYESEDLSFIQNLFKLYEEIVGEIIKLIEGLKKRVDSEKEYWGYKDNRGEIPAQVSEVERLFHASVNAREIYETGFQTNYTKPQSQGLGGSGHDEGFISFTYDLTYAREIARSLKEVVMIAKGEISFREIMSWFKHDGIEGEMVKFLEYEKIKSPHDPYNVFLLYNWYLWNSPLRENPLYINTGRSFIEHMKTKEVKNIGIVVASVEMKKDRVQFVQREREFRVKPSAIKSLDKLIV